MCRITLKPTNNNLKYTLHLATDARKKGTAEDRIDELFETRVFRSEDWVVGLGGYNKINVLTRYLGNNAFFTTRQVFSKDDADFKERFRLQRYAFHKFFVLFYPIFCCFCQKNGLHLRLEWVFPFRHNYAFRAPVHCAGAAVCVSPRLIKITSKHAQISFFSGRSAVAYSFGGGTIEKQTRAPLQHIAPGRPDAFGK